jgi:hypothetical protein
MSRSRSKVPYFQWNRNSEKEYKRQWHQTLRKEIRLSIEKQLRNPDADVIFPTENDVSDDWEAPKDGLKGMPSIPKSHPEYNIWRRK